MAIVSRMEDLPQGTVVYYWRVNAHSPSGIYRYKLDNNPPSCIAYYRFEFDPKDGLWATYLVRELWENYRSVHPHLSLFGFMYEKLKLQDYTS